MLPSVRDIRRMGAAALDLCRQAIAANAFGTLGANTYRRCTYCIACEVTQLCQNRA